MPVDVEIAVVEDLYLRSTASGVVHKQNETAETPAGAATGDKSCTACGRCVEELRVASECAAAGAAVVSDCAAGRGRAVETLEKCLAAECATRRAGVVSECAIARGRVIE